MNKEITEYGSTSNDYDYGVIGNYKLSKTLSIYTQIEYLNYFGRENKNMNIGLNYIIL